MERNTITRVSQAVLDYISTQDFEKICNMVERGYFKDYELDEIEHKLKRYISDDESCEV